MNNIYTVVPCRTYKATAAEACTLTDGHGLTLQLEPGTPATFEAHTAEIHATAPVVLEVTAPTAGKYVTVQVRGVKKVNESSSGIRFTRFLTSASGWAILDPQGFLQDLQMDCGGYCAPGWLFRALWERPSALGETAEANVGWEFVLRAGEEVVVLSAVRAYAASLEAATEGVNTLHVKLIYHD